MVRPAPIASMLDTTKLNMATVAALLRLQKQVGITSIYRKNLLPNRDRILFYSDGKEVIPGVVAMHTPGHTVGHTCFVIIGPVRVRSFAVVLVGGERYAPAAVGRQAPAGFWLICCLR